MLKFLTDLITEPGKLMDFAEIFTGPNMLALATLVILEVVLGVDNIIFMAIQLEKLPPEQRDKARYIGLGGAAGMRILFLFGISWIMSMKNPVLSFFGHGLSVKDLVMIAGGGYLLWHSVKEIHHKTSPAKDESHALARGGSSFAAIVASILVLDLVFSIDSVLTAVGMVDNIVIMVTAILISIVVMLAYSGVVIRFVNRYPAVQILALSFLVLIGVLLIAEGFGQHVSKGYVYSAVAFAILVECLQIKADRHKDQAA